MGRLAISKCHNSAIIALGIKSVGKRQEYENFEN